MYSRLGEWSPQLPTGFHGTRGTRHITSLGTSARLGYGGLTRSARPFQVRSPPPSSLPVPRTGAAAPPSSVMATTPRPHIGLPSTQWHRVWARAPVRSPLLGDFLPVPRGTKMFQFPRFPSHALPPAPPQRAAPGSRSSGILVYDHKGIAPFGDRRIIGRSHLPVAFRRLLRPSSAHGAKASTACRLPPLASHRSRSTQARPRLRRRLPRDQKHGSRHPPQPRRVRGLPRGAPSLPAQRCLHDT